MTINFYLCYGINKEFLINPELILLQTCCTYIILLQSMNIGKGDYYSIDGYGYTKYPNVEVIGIDPRQINALKNHHQSANRSIDKQVQQDSVIQQEDIQYDPQQVRYPLETGFNQPRQIIQQSEVNSVHMSIGGHKVPSAILTYSCFDSNATPHKANLKRSMQELEKNLTLQDETTEYRQLCAQLDKQKKMRKELQQSYRNLLSEIEENQRYESHHNKKPGKRQENRQLTGRTLRFGKEKSEPIQSCQDFSQESEKAENKSEIKTVKKAQIQKNVSIQLLPSEQEPNNEEDEQHNHDEEEELDQNQKYNKDFENQEDADEENNYFREEREFQGKVLFDLSNLSRKITNIDDFLVQSAEIREKERLNKVIEEKQRQIKKIQLQNERLKQGKQGDLSAKVINQGVSNNNLQNMINNVTPNTLYLFAILLMAIVAIAS